MPAAAQQQTAAVRSDNPLSGDPDAIKAGRKLFNTWCTQCHGGKADGESRFGKYAADLPSSARATPSSPAMVVAGRPDRTDAALGRRAGWRADLADRRLSRDARGEGRQLEGLRVMRPIAPGSCAAGAGRRHRPGAAGHAKGPPYLLEEGTWICATPEAYDRAIAEQAKTKGYQELMALKDRAARGQELHVRRRRRHRGHDGAVRHVVERQGDKVKVEFWIEFYKKIAELQPAGAGSSSPAGPPRTAWPTTARSAA